MNVTFEPGFEPNLLKQVGGVLPDLEEALGVAKDRVAIVWTPVPTQNGQAAKLQITDDGVSRSDTLTAHDFARENRAFFRMGRLWDSVLVERDRIIAARVNEALAAEGR